MKSQLPPTGTEDFLELLSPFVPDDYLDERWPRLKTGGRRYGFSASQLFRLHLLALITPVHSINLLIRMLPEQKAWRRFAHVPSQEHVPGVRMMNRFREAIGVDGLRQVNGQLLAPIIGSLDVRQGAAALIDATDLPAACSGFKKSTGLYTAKRAALGGRTLKSGQSQWFVGYKKHTFRLWISWYERGVLLVPLVSWAAPANVSEGGLLIPSLRYCARCWSWWPSHVVADMGYIGAEAKRLCREQWHVTVLTHVRENMKMVPPLESETRAVCHQGQTLQWLGYDWRSDEHEFGPAEPASLCAICWEQSQCERRFAYSPSEHESLLGLLPLCTRAAQRILKQMRPWIEPTQSYEKNQLGLSQMFLNSLRLTWSMCSLADSISIMRARALLERPPSDSPLKALLPTQLAWDWA